MHLYQTVVYRSLSYLSLQQTSAKRCGALNIIIAKIYRNKNMVAGVQKYASVIAGHNDLLPLIVTRSIGSRHEITTFGENCSN